MYFWKISFCTETRWVLSSDAKTPRFSRNISNEYGHQDLSFLIFEHQLRKLMCIKPYTSCNVFSSVMNLQRPWVFSLSTLCLDSSLWAACHSRCLHQTGKRLPAWDHLYCGAETPSHPPFLCWQEWASEWGRAEVTSTLILSPLPWER